MSFRKFRWSKVYESSEEELVALLKSHKIKGSRMHVEAGAEQSKQQAVRATTIWCAEGSLVTEINSTSASLQPGDALSIDADTSYSVSPGISGGTYYLSK
jgi:quercetin dioxygenase-like cupin family protein